MNRRPKRPLGWPRWGKVVAAILIAGFLAFVWSRLPSGAYPTDLARVGAGRPVLVLAHDSNSTRGVAVMAATTCRPYRQKLVEISGGMFSDI